MNSSRPITILCLRFWPDAHGGVEQRLRALADRFAARSIPVTVLCENRTASPPVDHPTAHLTVHRIPPLSAGRLWRLDPLLRIRWWAAAIRRSAPPGPLWAAEPLAAIAAILAGRRRDLIFNPACCTQAMRTVALAYPHVDSMHNPLLLRRLDRLAARLAPTLFVGSNNLRDQIARHYGRAVAVHVVPHGGDFIEPTSKPPITRSDARAAFGLHDRDFVIGLAGRLDPCKDIPFLFHAVAAMPPSEPSRVRLLVVGEGPDRPRLDRIAAELHLTDRILWTGRLDRLTAAYSAMDVLVLPSVYEAFGNVLVEAQTAGVPVIARRRDSDPARPVLTAAQEIIDHGRTGFIVDPHDLTDLAARLAQLRDHAALRAALAAAAQKHAARFTWDRAVDAYLNVLGIEARDSVPTDHSAPIIRRGHAA